MGEALIFWLQWDIAESLTAHRAMYWFVVDVCVLCVRKQTF